MELRSLVRELPGDDDPAEFTKRLVAFQDAIVEAAQSDRIPLVLQALSSIVPRTFFAVVAAAIPVQRRGLTPIARTVAAGDADRAAHEYLVMMRRVGEIVTQLFIEQGLLDAAARDQARPP